MPLRAPLTAVLLVSLTFGCGSDQSDKASTGALGGNTSRSSPATGGTSLGGANLGGTSGGTLGGGSGGGGSGNSSVTNSAGQSGLRSTLMQADFQRRTVGTYAASMIADDFGAAAAWNDGLDEGRATVVEESGERFLRVTYVGGVYGPTDGGVQFLVPLGGSFEELFLSYRIRFATGFTFMLGGKLPGLVGGTHPTGCTADDGGFSARMMWRKGGAAVQYLYYPEKASSCGDDFAYLSGTSPVAFVPGQWHRVQHHIVMNDAGEHNGALQAQFDSTLVLDNPTLLYRIAGATFGIDALYFSTFFGGSDSTWAPPTAQVADFDDFLVTTVP